jgi:predicted transporter
MQTKRFHRRMVYPMLVAIIVPYVLCALQAISLSTAVVIQFLGVSFIIISNIVWILLVNSVERWPEDNTFIRFSRIMTFSKK